MATTSIWSVKGWLGKLIIYIENPEKTNHPDRFEMEDIDEQTAQSLTDVIQYAIDTHKTVGAENMADDEGELILQQYVSGINCTPATAREEMTAVKVRYGKNEGIIAFHGYQSFAPGECTPDMAHEIGLKLAEELWGDRFQVLVATHLDKENHLHNHFVVNSVSFLDGLRYHRSNQDYRDMRRVSDRLCKKNGLSVIEKPWKNGKHYAEWKAEQEGKPTYRGMVKIDIDEIIAKAKTEKQFFYLLREKGYIIKVGKDITVRPKHRDRGVKLARNFGEAYTIESIRERILSNLRSDIVKKEIRQEERKRPYRFRVQVNKPGQKRKIKGLRGLYLHYGYLLGIFPKTSAKVTPNQLHFLLREDLIKLNTIQKETKLLCHYRIDTAEQLFLCQENLQKKIEQLSTGRQRLRNRKRYIKDKEELGEVKAEIAKLTEQIGELREEVKLCQGIAERSGVIKEKIKIVHDEERTGKEEIKHEHVR